jgi:amidase
VSGGRTASTLVDRSIGTFAYDPALAPRARLRPGASAHVETRDPRSGALLVGPPDTFQPYPPPPGGRSNALTGPIEIDGFSAGDVLAVTITSVDPDPVGYMAAKDLGHVVPPGSIDDAAIGVVSVDAGSVRWRGHRLPYRPMVGCLGVAHPDAPSSGSVGVFGGNFDHVVLGRGCTAYLPTFVDGALLYVGDVHAAMGDGELSCGGVEIAATVGIRVDRPGATGLRQPRFETDTHVVTTGWSRDFAEARRMAVADMLEVLTACLGIGTAEAFMLVSVAADLRIGQACGNMELTLRLEMPRLEGVRALPGLGS